MCKQSGKKQAFMWSGSFVHVFLSAHIGIAQRFSVKINHQPTFDFP